METKTKILVCTQIGRGKEYTLSFLKQVVRRMVGVSDICYAVEEVAQIPNGWCGDFQRGLYIGDKRQEWLLPRQENTPPFRYPWSRCSAVRAKQREFFLNGDWTHIFWHDSDGIPPADIVQRLLELKTDVAGSAYVVRNATSPVLAYSPEDEVGLWDASRIVIKSNPDGTFADGTLSTRTKHLGFAAVLITREAMQKVPFMDASLMDSPEQYVMGEDYQWCEDWANAGGSRPYVDNTTNMWHVSETGFGNRLVIGEEVDLIRYVGSSHTCRTRHGIFHRGVWTVSPTQVDNDLVVGFERTRGHAPSVETLPLSEILKLTGIV